MVNAWTRDDLPGVHWPGIHGESERQGAEKALDAVVDHLNANHPKSGTARWRRAHEIVEAERDTAREQRDMWKLEHDRLVIHGSVRGDTYAAMVRDRDDWRDKAYSASEGMRKATARAEAAEKRHQWPKTTPTGHTYVAPDTYVALCHQHSNAAQAEVECWEADECPPEPTWEMVGIAHREVERLQRDRDEWKARAEAAEARTTPAVSRADVAEALSRCINPEMWNVTFPSVVDEVWSLVSGDDPAVFVVRESDVSAVQVRRNAEGDWWTKDRGCGRGATADGMRQMAGVFIRDAIEYEAFARAIEAGQATDPVEELAWQIESATREAIRQVCDELADVAPSLDPLTVERAMEVTAASRKVAAHVLGQEANDGR